MGTRLLSRPVDLDRKTMVLVTKDDGQPLQASKENCFLLSKAGAKQEQSWSKAEQIWRTKLLMALI